jgi:hypothetical protein
VDSEQIMLHELQMDAEQAGPGTAVIATWGESCVMSKALLSTDKDDCCWADVEPLSAPPRRRKTGGRQAGTPNKKTAMRRALISAALVSGKDPMTFFTEILANEDNPLMLRFEAAAISCPTCAPSWPA